MRTEPDYYDVAPGREAGRGLKPPRVVSSARRRALVAPGREAGRGLKHSEVAVGDGLRHGVAPGREAGRGLKPPGSPRSLIVPGQWTGQARRSIVWVISARQEGGRGRPSS